VEARVSPRRAPCRLHRGLPGAPGRVVTLVAEPRAVCWGVAYRVDTRDRDAVLATLDQRERGGFERREVEVRLREPGGGSVEALVYVADADNPNYLGPAPVSEIATQVRRSVGPSGPNRDYVLHLADALRALRAHDAHVFEVAEQVDTGA
jgi:cation transport protein ChaC